jgi:hypothetical protein
VRIDRGRASATESHFRNAPESESCPYEHNVDCLQSDFERSDWISARQQWNLDAVDADADVIRLVGDELEHVYAEQRYTSTVIRELFDDELAGFDEHDGAGFRGIWSVDEQSWHSWRNDERPRRGEPGWSQRFHNAVDRNNDVDILADASDRHNVDRRSAAVSTVIRRSGRDTGLASHGEPLRQYFGEARFDHFGLRLLDRVVQTD